MSRVRKVYSYDLYGKYKNEYDSLADASRKLGLHREGYIYRRVRYDDRTSSIYLHRELMGLTDEELTVDHIDGDGLNNKKSNLRIVTQQGNNRNRRGNPKNYYYNRKDGRWAVNLSVNNKTVYFGSYETEEEAKDKAKRVREEYYVIEEF